MSKTISRRKKRNNRANRGNLHVVEVQSEKVEKDNKSTKLQAKKNKMKVDGTDKKKKKSSSFVVGNKKLETKLSATVKAKAVQAMELDN